MKTQGISFYFVLYLVAVITVFVITMERDQLLRERDEDIAHLVELYVRPLVLTPYMDTAVYYMDPRTGIASTPIAVRAKVEGPLEKQDVEFSLVRAWSDQGGVPGEVDGEIEVTNEQGDGLLKADIRREGTYFFQLAGYSRRIVLDGNTIHLKIKDTTYSMPYSPQLEDVDRDTVLLVARVEKSGIDPLQFVISVQDPAENWILGPPYAKKIFISGVEDPGRVTFAAPAGTRIDRPREGGAFVVLTWEAPRLGRKDLTVRAQAHRGYGGKDEASVSFAVDILPPNFVSDPSSRGFWGVPYKFDGRIQGLNPVDLTISIIHENVEVGSGSATREVAFTPERNWSSLECRVSYRGHMIKSHSVELSAPPPPQIRWLGQELDRGQGLFKVNLSAVDAAEGPVRLSIEAQPLNVARVDKISGKNFTITVNLSEHPAAVFLKVTATDQFGGKSVSTKQFNIPQ